jgi:3-oxoacyl-[acyl-carrier-protein] synthase II
VRKPEFDLSKRRVVITGLGVATPIGLGIEPFWEALLRGECGIRRTRSFDPSGLACQVCGELPEFSFGDFIPKAYRKSAKVMARDIVIAMVAAYHAVKDAALATKCIVERGEAPGPPNVDSTRFGANIGAGLICADLDELAGALSTAIGADGRFSLKRWGAEGMNNLTPLWLLKFLPNMLACHVTIVHDAQAPSNTITCGEASSHLAIGEAFRTIARGDADVCICGGAESKANPMAVARPLICGRLNTENNGTPAAASRPFAADRGGMVPAEGGGLIILESLEHARLRKARIYAELAGFGAAASTVSWAKPDESGRAVALALHKAISDAGATVNDMDLAVPLGTGTRQHDAGEMNGWGGAFGERLSKIPAMTTRGTLGNNGAGTGAIDFAAAVMSLYRNTVPASRNTERLDPQCRFQFNHGDAKDMHIRQAITSASAMTGGQSAALVIRKYEG